MIPINSDDVIKNRIYTIRGQQVMLDSDIAELFGVKTKRLNEQMKRNVGRFPDDFCFKLNSKEFKELRSQIATIDVGYKSPKYLPFVYTEHGIVALAGVLKSDIAEKMSVEIVRTFIRMRQFIKENGDMLLGLAKLQNRQLEFENETNLKFEQVFKKMDQLDLPKSALFYAGQWYDAREYISSLIAKANSSLILIDPFFDNRALSFLSNKKEGVSVIVVSSKKGKIRESNLRSFESQYGHITIKTQNDIHDRFLIIDETEYYGLGTSLNFAGTKLFEIHEIEDEQIKTLLLQKAKEM